MRRYLIAIALSLLICAGWDFVSLRKLSQLRETVAEKRRELAKVATRDAEVVQFQAAKDRLQRRIDVINSLRTKQPRVSRPLAFAVAASSQVPSVDAIGLNGSSLTVAGHADSAKDLDSIAATIAAFRCHDGLNPAPCEKVPAPNLTVQQPLEEIIEEPEPREFVAHVADQRTRIDCEAAHSKRCIAFLLRADIVPQGPQP